jgi:NADH:ubiquinone oxidoreductase subunit 6 (subunit J)
MSVDVALFLSAILLVAVVVALFSKSVTVSLIALFYASISLGITFTLYGSVLVGLLEIITFAGAISVMLLTAILMIGESKLDIGASKLKLVVVGISIVTVSFATALILERGLPFSSSSATGVTTFSPSDLLQFVWEFRPWDLLILLIIFASAMVVVTNLFSKEV